MREIKEYPTPWYYEAAENWITRRTDPEGGEIWCVFKQEPEPDEVEWLLEKLNEYEEEHGT